ncbi:hypothetical protein AB9E19_15270 [Rhizobium leguminosarum]|uniref:hypothetical protein n=1 Tax=Rhizobium leguminosarum TaxID=384 RepID=UPI003F9830FC
MWEKFINFCRQHIISVFIAGLTLGSGSFAALYEAGINRVEDLKVVEFNELMSENKKFLEGLNAFTEEVALKGKIDPKKKSELSASLARLYTNLGAFTVNVSAENEASVRDLQTSVNEVKKQVQLMKKKQDLDPLGVSMVDYFEKLNAAKPIIEAAVGKNPAPSET